MPDPSCSTTVAAPQIPMLEGRPSHVRFHFHMDKCIGCHACEVACSEQNGLPVDTQWRRVGMVESAGTYPDVSQFFLSSGCNHCLEPSCLKGCPVNAYEKLDNGIVIHKDDVCIGCSYCTWNCPYGVPVYQEDRKIVTKCDLCVRRLEAGRLPACAEACPVGAIQIETVDVATLRRTALREGAGPAMPSPEITVPSTKITLPEGMRLEDFRKSDHAHVKPEEPHTPLIVLTVLSQLGFGGFLIVFLVDLLRLRLSPSHAVGPALGWVAPALLAVVVLSLNASLLHLGRPAYALRALTNWRYSWLSREVIGLSAFAAAATVYALLLFVTEAVHWMAPARLGGHGLRLAVGVLTVVAGVLGVYCSSMLYRVPARPAWNSPKTTLDFFEVALILGPAFYTVAAAIALAVRPETSLWFVGTLRWAAVATGLGYGLKAVKNAFYIRQWDQGSDPELRASARLRLRTFWRFRFARNLVGLAALFLAAAVALNTPRGSALLASTSLLLALMTAVSFMNRYLFFVTVVPKNIPGNLMVLFGSPDVEVCA